MDAECADAGENINHLQNVLSETELSNLPTPVTEKINKYIEGKFEEYLTSKALHETSKAKIGDKITESETKILELTAKYEDAKAKLTAAEETVAELGKQVETLITDLQNSQNKIIILENQVISLKSSRDAAIDERNDLTRIIERSNAEIERCKSDAASLETQLRSAIDAKCQALALNDEIQSNELALQYREKRMEQERVLLNSQISALSEEVNRLTSELQTIRLNNSSRVLTLETQLTEKTEELKTANDTIAQLHELNNNLNGRVENLSQRLLEQRKVEDKMTENYKKELDAKSKVAELYKTMHDDNDARTTELSEGISELQKLLHEATEKYGELETKYKQSEIDNEALMEKKNEIISSLKTELEHANDLLKAADAHNLDLAVGDLAPSAASASKLLKSSMSLTQVYSQLVKITDDLNEEKKENRRLKSTLNSIIQELEEKAPYLQKQRTEYEETMESNMALTQQLDSLVAEMNRLKDKCDAESIKANHSSRENIKLKGELADLGRQVCLLLKEIEESRGRSMPNGDYNSASQTNSFEQSPSRVSKTLVTFRDVEDLQSNNQKLLSMVRELTEKQEELERHKEQVESGILQNKIDSLNNRVIELTEAQERQTKMVNGLIRQRDMFKQLYHDHMKGKRHEMSQMMDISDVDNTATPTKTSFEKPESVSTEVTVLEVKLKLTEKQLELLKEEYKTYKEEKVNNEKMLYEQIDNMRQEIAKLTAANSKFSSTAEYNNERLKVLQTNIATYKKQVGSLEEKNKIYNTTIAKHEVALQNLRDEALNAQSKVAAAEVTIANLKLECKLLKDTDLRLQSENKVLNRERQGQALLLANLELIKASVERVEMEGHTKLGSRLDEATRECAALRRRLQEEQDRFRELSSHLERQTETAKTRMQEEKNAADVMRTEILQLRQELTDKNRSNEDLAKKLKMALTPNTGDMSFDLMKKNKDLELKLAENDSEIKSLQEQINVAKEHIKQYCDISECAEKEMKTLNEEYKKYKMETEEKLTELTQKVQNLQEHCSELEAELSIQASGDTSTSVNVRNELMNTKNQLKDALDSLAKCNEELNVARLELSKLSETVQIAEDKYGHEMILHSADIQTLTQVKEELSVLQVQLREIHVLKDDTIKNMEAEKVSSQERESLLRTENEQLLSRLENLNSQNSLLHDQIQALSTQLSAVHASRSFTDSVNESASDSNMNISVSEEEGRSSEQMLQIVKFLRKEKDIAMAKCDILQAETMRLKSQLEITEKKLDDTKLALGAERETSEVSMVTITKQSDILRKVETLNALTDSNRILREERDSLLVRVTELTSATKSLEEQLCPLQEKIADLHSKNETLQSENSSLKADCARWRTRVNSLVERANKTSPEDWKRLQNERETLARMLTAEKETVKKLSEELGSVKIEKSKLEEQQSSLSRRYSALVEENKKINEDVQTLKDDMARLTEELTKLKGELATTSEMNVKLTAELSNSEASLMDIRNKEKQIRKIAIKYKGSFEELAKSVEDEKKKSEGEAAAADNATTEAAKKSEEIIAQLQNELDTEKANNDKLKSELETLRTANLDKEEKAKQVLKQAKNKIVQLTESKNTLTRELNESRSKIETIEQSNRDEQDVRLTVIKSQYEGRLTRLEKEKNEAQAEKTREVEGLLQKINLLQRQLANQSSAVKQQTSTEKTTSDTPPTANIRPLAGVPQQSVSGSRRGGETPLASIRPMAQVAATVTTPHDAHSTEYMPASSSRPRATVTASTAPPESTQDMDTSEAGNSSSAASDSTAQPSSHLQPFQQQVVALVLPRIEQQSGAASSVSNAVASASTTGSPAGSVTASAAAASPNVVSPASGMAPATTGSAAEGAAEQASSGGVSTSHAPPEPRPAKRARPAQRPHPAAKRTRVQGFERSVEVEYQVPTSSRCDQDDEGVIVVDSEEDEERCTGTMYREGEEEEEEEEEDEEVEEEQEVEAGEEEEEEEVEGPDGEDTPSTRPESPVQSAEAGSEGSLEEAGAAAARVEADAPPHAHVVHIAHPQIEAISSGTEPSGALSLGGGGGDDGDDSIVPSTPTLYVPRRNDGFGEAVVSPVGGAGAGGGGGARFTFAEAGAASHHDTHADLAAALPPPSQGNAHSQHDNAEEPEPRSEEDAPAVSSQGSGPSSPHQVSQIAEEGREAEASASPRRRPFRAAPAPQRWSPLDSDTNARGRGAARARGRGGRRPHGYSRF